MRYFIKLILIFYSISVSAQEENWDAYMANEKGKVASILLNLDLKKTAPLKHLPYLVITGVGFSNCTPAGMPTKTEFENLYRISDSLSATMKKIGNNKLVGTYTHNCERKDFYYVADTVGINETLKSRLQQLFPQYKTIINISLDSSWTGYLNFLYPNDETLEVMKNQKVVDQLQKGGDKLTQPRKIDHWLYFSSESDRSCFVLFAMKQKFKIESIGKDGPLANPFKLVVSRSDIPEVQSISKLTLLLEQEAEKCKGVYDGWETFVVK